MVCCNFFIAAAIGTKRFAKRQMNVQADALPGVVQFKLLGQQLFPMVGVKPLFPNRHRGIAGVTGNRTVVFLCQVPDDMLLHGAKLLKQTALRPDKKTSGR